MSDATLSSGWLAVQRHQQFLENTVHITAAAHAAEDALTSALDAFDAGNATGEDVDHRFHSRRLNRVRRNRRRERLLDDHVELTVRAEQDDRVRDAVVEAENHELLVLVGKKLDARQFGLLMRVSKGVTYAELSVERGVAEKTIRAYVCRIRDKAASFAA